MHCMQIQILQKFDSPISVMKYGRFRQYKTTILKLKSIHRSFLSSPIKGRSQYNASLHCDEYEHLRTSHNYNAGKML